MPNRIRTLRCVFVACLVGCAASGATAQSMYRWVDRDGHVHYTEQPPPRDARSVQNRATTAGSDEGSRLDTIAKAAPVVLYTAPPCEKPCRDARSFLTARGVPHRVVDLADLASFERFKKETGASEVPVLSVGERVLKGFEAGSWAQALDQAGYPKTAPATRPARAVAPPPPARGRYESSLPAPPPSIRLYVSPDCGEPCDQARKYLSGRGVRATEISTADPAGFADLQSVSGGTTVPSLVVGGRVVKGFQATQYEAALEARGR